METYKMKNNKWCSYSLFCFFEKFEMFECILALLACFVQLIVILNIGFGFVVVDCIWEHGLHIVLRCFQNVFKNVPEVWTILGRTIYPGAGGINQ